MFPEFRLFNINFGTNRDRKVVVVLLEKLRKNEFKPASFTKTEKRFPNFGEIFNFGATKARKVIEMLLERPK